MGESMHTEETLRGGNMTSVLKKHGKIHRERHPWSPSTQRLLLHLEAAGFHQAPKYLGIDVDGRRESIALFFHAYQMPCPENLFEIMAERLHALADYIRSEAQKKNPVFEKITVSCFLSSVSLH